MNKLIAYEILFDNRSRKEPWKFVRGRLYNKDFYLVDQRRAKREIRRHKRRLKAIKIACSYTVTKEEIAESLYQAIYVKAYLHLPRISP